MLVWLERILIERSLWESRWKCHFRSISKSTNDSETRRRCSICLFAVDRHMQRERLLSKGLRLVYACLFGWSWKGKSEFIYRQRLTSKVPNKVQREICFYIIRFLDNLPQFWFCSILWKQFSALVLYPQPLALVARCCSQTINTATAFHSLAVAVLVASREAEAGKRIRSSLRLATKTKYWKINRKTGGSLQQYWGEGTHFRILLKTKDLRQNNKQHLPFVHDENRHASRSGDRDQETSNAEASKPEYVQANKHMHKYSNLCVWVSVAESTFQPTLNVRVSVPSCSSGCPYEQLRELISGVWHISGSVLLIAGNPQIEATCSVLFNNSEVSDNLEIVSLIPFN